MPSFFKVANLISEFKKPKSKQVDQQQQHQQQNHQQQQQQQYQQYQQHQQQYQQSGNQYIQQPVYIPPQHFSPAFQQQQFSPTFQQQFSPTWQQPQHPDYQQSQSAPPQPTHQPPPPPLQPQNNPHVYIPHSAPPAPTDLPPAYSAPVRPKSRGSIRAGLKRISSKASLRRKGTSSASSSTVEVNNAGLPRQSTSSSTPPPLPTESRQGSEDGARNVELTPPPSGGKTSPTPMTLPPQPVTQTPNSEAFVDEDDLYSDPYKSNDSSSPSSPPRNAMPKLITDVPPAAPMPPQDAFEHIQDQTLQQQQLQHQQNILLMQQQQQQQQQYSQPIADPRFFVRTMLETIPASPATTLASPVSPVTGSSNPFRKSSLAAQMQEGATKASSPLIGSETVAADEPEIRVEEVAPTPTTETGRISPKLGLQTNVPSAPTEMSPKSPETATRLMMQGVKVEFKPPPVVDPTPEPEPQPSPRFADNNPFKSLCEEGPNDYSKPAHERRGSLTALGIKPILPPTNTPIMGVRAAAAAKAAAMGGSSSSSSSSSPAPLDLNGGESSSRPRSSGRTPPPVPPRTPQNGNPIKPGQKFKRAPEPKNKAKLPDNFIPPPPPPMEMPKGWTARWDDKEQKYAYYHGTKGRDKQYDMPTEEYKKMSIKDKRAGKKKAVANAVSNLGMYAETASPTTPTGPQISPLLPTPPLSAHRANSGPGAFPSPTATSPAPTAVKVGGAAD